MIVPVATVQVGSTTLAVGAAGAIGVDTTIVDPDIQPPVASFTVSV